MRIPGKGVGVGFGVAVGVGDSVGRMSCGVAMGVTEGGMGVGESGKMLMVQARLRVTRRITMSWVFFMPGTIPEGDGLVKKD